MLSPGGPPWGRATGVSGVLHRAIQRRLAHACLLTPLPRHTPHRGERTADRVLFLFSQLNRRMQTPGTHGFPTSHLEQHEQRRGGRSTGGGCRTVVSCSEDAVESCSVSSTQTCPSVSFCCGANREPACSPAAARNAGTPSLGKTRSHCHDVHSDGCLRTRGTAVLSRRPGPTN